MHDKWIQGIEDEVPEAALDEVEDPLVRVEIQELHAKLKRLDGENHKRKTDLFEKHGIMFRTDQDVHLRLQLLVEMFIGHLSPERLRFEVRWAEMTKDALEQGYADYLEAKREARTQQTLTLPGGKQHVVPSKPKEQPNAG